MLEFWQCWPREQSECSYVHMSTKMSSRSSKRWASWGGPSFLKHFLNASYSFSSVQSLSCVRLFATTRTAARLASLSITNTGSPLKPMTIESMMPSRRLILCHTLLLLPSIFPSIKVFWNESAFRIKWPKYWSFSFSISLSNEYSRVISFRMDSFDFLAVQGTPKSLLQHHNSKASIIWCSALFMVQLSHLYMTTGKTLLPNNVSAF